MNNSGDKPKSLRRPSHEDDTLYNRVDEAIWNAVSDAGKFSAGKPRANAIAGVFQLIDQFLADPTTDYSCQLYNIVGDLISREAFHQAAWSWLKNRIFRMTDHFDQHLLILGALRDVPQDPIIENDVDQLLSLLHHSETSWAVFGAYDEFDDFADRLRRQYSDHAKRRRRLGEEHPPFPEQWLQDWIDQFHVHDGE